MKAAGLAWNMPLSSSPGKQTQLSLLPYPSPTYFASESLFQEFSLDTSSSVDIYQVLTLCKNLCLEEQKMPWAGEKKKDTAPALMELMDKIRRRHSIVQEAIQSEQKKEGYVMP